MSKRSFTSSDGVELSYGDFGPPDGRAVVLCHGLGADCRQFAGDAEHFAGQGFRVLTPDVRGHGRSGAPDGRQAEDFTIARLARDMGEMLDHGGVGPVDWVGNSLGGIIALHMLGSDRARIRSLATFGTGYALNLPRAAAAALPMLYRVFGRRLTAGVTARMTSPRAEARALIGQMLLDFDQHAGRAVAENVRRYDLTEHAQSFDGPILLVRGGRDRAVNLALGRTISAMREHKDFTLIDLPEAGHVANLDAPDQVRELLKTFWARAGR